MLSQELCPHVGDPGDCLLNRLLREEEGCSIEEARQWRQAYLRFLWLKAREGDVAGLRLCASPALERAWRLHVLDTRAYSLCCAALLLPRPSTQASALLHFNPDGESGGSIAGACRTLLAYERHVGRLPGPVEEGAHYWLFPSLTGRAIVTVDYPWGEGGAAAPPRPRRQVEVVAALEQPARTLLPLLPGLLRAGLQLQARTAVGLLSSLERPLWSLLLVPEEEEGGQASSSASHSRLRLVLLPEEEALLQHEEEKEEEDPSATVQPLDPSWGGERQWQQWQHEQQPAEDEDDGGQLCVQAADEQGDDEAPAGQPVLLRSPSQYHPH